jgi:hypothetical protein
LCSAFDFFAEERTRRGFGNEKPWTRNVRLLCQDYRDGFGLHPAGRDDGLVSVAPLLDRCAGDSPIPISIGTEPSGAALSVLRAAERSGTHSAPRAFLNRLARPQKVVIWV